MVGCIMVFFIGNSLDVVIEVLEDGVMKIMFF